MPHYSDETIDKVLYANDIVDVVGSYVQLKKKGGTYFGLCPFHNEKTPSFSVDERKQMFYCFGCHKGGSAITFLMEMESFTFAESIGFLADRAGISLPKESPSSDQYRQSRQRDNLLDICREAKDYYHGILLSKEGERGLSYLRSRGLTDETIDRFSLGFATSRGGLYGHLKNLGYDDDTLLKSGLVSFSEKDGFRDKFWNRVMFPILDANKKTIAFGGRVMGDGEPKYLNSPETDIFNKRKTLFGLCFARASRRRGLILCEGYMDVITLHQAGFDNAVAALGTAFTQEHAAMLPRFADGQVYICFDSDGPGRDAVRRAIPMLAQKNLTTRVIRMNPHKDPDEFIKALGQEAFEDRIKNADNSFLFEMECLSDRFDRSDPTELTSFQGALSAEIVRRFREPLTRENYITAVAERFSMDRELLRQRVNNLGELSYTPPGEETAPQRPVRLSAGEKRRQATNERQTLLLHYLAEYPALYPQIKDIIGVEDFDPPLLRRAAQILYAQLEKGGVDPMAVLKEFTEPSDADVITGIFYKGFSTPSKPDEALSKADEAPERPEDVARGIGELVVSIKRESLKKAVPEEGASFARAVEEKRLLESISRRQFSVN